MDYEDALDALISALGKVAEHASQADKEALKTALANFPEQAYTEDILDLLETLNNSL